MIKAVAGGRKTGGPRITKPEKTDRNKLEMKLRKLRGKTKLL